MDFSFTDEQQMLRDGLAKYLDKSYDFDARQKLVRSDAPWSASAWEQFAEFGLLALPFTEDQGGLGGSIADCVAVAELLGRNLVIEPYTASIMLAGQALSASETAVAGDWLEKVIAGEAIAAFAYEEGAGTAAPELVAMEASAADDSVTLSGAKRVVVAGAEADVLVVVARKPGTQQPALYLVQGDAAGLSKRAYLTIDGRSAADIGFDQVAAIDICCADDALERVIAHAIIVQCAEAVGAMGALLAMTADYAMTRKQFGVPIGTFQAVAHRLADMKIAYTKARATLIYTAALAEAGGAGARDIAVLKAQTGKLGKAIGEAAIQTHGGVGITDELSVSHYHKRLLASDATFGDHTYHFRKVGGA